MKEGAAENVEEEEVEEEKENVEEEENVKAEEEENEEEKEEEEVHCFAALTTAFPSFLSTSLPLTWSFAC